MSSILRARVVRAPASGVPDGSPPPIALLASKAHRRRVAREELEARLAAESIVRAAEARAREIVADAEQRAARSVEDVARRAEERAEASVAARWLALRQQESTRLDREASRVAAVAVVLAERLLGAALDLRPERIGDMARVALAEAHGARRVAIDVHPADADVLVSCLGAAGLHPPAVDVERDGALARGDLRLKTDVGTLDAKLSLRLERLAAALGELLPRGDVLAG